MTTVRRAFLVRRSPSATSHANVAAAAEFNRNLIDAAVLFGLKLHVPGRGRERSGIGATASIQGCRARSAFHPSEPCRLRKVEGSNAKERPGKLNAARQLLVLRRISRGPANNRVTEVTWLPAPKLQHLRGFPTVVGVTRAPG